jgi:signal peptidase I
MNRYRSPYITCRGSSMFPSLRDGDGLILRKCAGPADLRRGDTIVFPHPREPYDVAHRVVRILPAGAATRGDANGRTDPDIIPWTLIRGRVVSVRRGRKTFSPASGKRGMAVHVIGLARMHMRRAAAPPFRAAVDAIARAGVFRFLRPLVQTRVVALGRDGTETFILRRGIKPIGRKSAATGGRWDIRFPYRLILDRNKLP